MKSFRNKLTMCACALVPFAGVADAAELIVFEAPLSWNQEVSAEFAVNRELRRAWVDVAVASTDPGDGPQEREVIPKAVEGLYYDPPRRQVLYRTATETIVCAEDATFLWRTYLRATGRCLLTPLSEQRKTDDGFKIRERTVAKVVFQAQPSALAGEPGGGGGKAAVDPPAAGRPQRDVGGQGQPADRGSYPDERGALQDER